MDLLHLCLTLTYFQHNVKHYKQLNGTAMSSPVSIVVAEIVMQNIEEQALATYSETLPLWLRYVDDTITALHENKIDEFLEHLMNKQNNDIQFTQEIEGNGKIPFLDCLVTRENNTLRTTVSRKLTHTYRLKRITILLHIKRLRCEPWQEEHKLFATQTTVWPTKSRTWTLFLLRTTTTHFIERNTYITPKDSSNNSFTTT